MADGSPEAPDPSLARLRRTRPTAFRPDGLLLVAGGAEADAALQLAGGCLDFVRKRLRHAIGSEPMTDIEAWTLELLVDTALAAYSACGAEG